MPVVYANQSVKLDIGDFPSPEEEEKYWEEVASQYRFTPPPSGFIGRDLDILLIEQALIKHNILLLRGMGGTGKTTLLNYLREWWQITNFANKIFYFGYDARAWNLEQIVLEIGKQLYSRFKYSDFQATKPNPRAMKLVAKLRAESHIIILDNLESVTGQPLAIQNTLEEAEQELIKDFLSQLVEGNTKVILGSRSGETWLQPTTFRENCYQLGGLDPQARTNLAEKILQRVAPSKTETIKADRHFQRLMNLLAGYPLAMEVVLSNLKQQTAEEIITKLDAADIDSGGDDKTNNIVKCIEYSHSNLSPQAQKLLLCLAPFRKFIDRSDIPNYVKQLEKQEPFQNYELDQLATAIDEATNWGLLSPINPDYPQLLTIQPVLPYFLQTKLNQTDTATSDALREAFNQHYQGLARSYFQYMQSQKAEERKLGITFVRLEYENLYQGLQINLEQQTSPYVICQCLYIYLGLITDYPNQLQLTKTVYDALEAYPKDQRNERWEQDIAPFSISLANCYLRHQDYDEAKKVYQQALTQISQFQNIEASQKKSYLATIYHQLGMVAEKLRSYEQAGNYYQQALDLYIEYGDRYEQAGTYLQLGNVARELRSYEQAGNYYQQALDLYIEYGDRFSQASTYHGLGNVALELRSYEQAGNYYQQALDLYIEYGDRYEQASIYYQLGIVAQELREYDQAKNYYQQALDLYIEYGDRFSQASTYHQLGNIAVLLREYDQAQDYYQQALDLYIEYGDRFEQASTYHGLGNVALELRSYEQARNYYQQALDLKIEYGDRYEQAKTYHGLGIVAQELRSYEQAGHYYQQALDIYIESGDRFSQASIYYQLGIVAQNLREYEQADNYYQQALELNIEYGDRFSQAHTYGQLGIVAHELREYEQAGNYYQQALDLKIEYGDHFKQARTYHNLGMVAQKLREYDQAKDYYQQALDLKIEYGDRYEQAKTYHNLGNVALELREYEQAGNYYQQALDLKIEYGDRFSQASSYFQLGKVAEALSDMEKAKSCYLKDLELTLESNDQDGLGVSLVNLARFYQSTQDQTLITEAAKILAITEEELQELVTKIDQERERDSNGDK